MIEPWRDSRPESEGRIGITSSPAIPLLAFSPPPRALPSLWRGELRLIPDAGHVPHWEQPAAFNRLLEDFVKETAK